MIKFRTQVKQHHHCKYEVNRSKPVTTMARNDTSFLSQETKLVGMYNYHN